MPARRRQILFLFDQVSNYEAASFKVGFEQSNVFHYICRRSYLSRARKEAATPCYGFSHERESISRFIRQSEMPAPNKSSALDWLVSS